ncbi:MAG: YegS/Rv2252/BmrU family lipid kinase [Clostridia bacterium]|nr:YegS/Rv2252/BmrU family lipid kinase [Clostridia bacterium]
MSLEIKNKLLLVLNPVAGKGYGKNKLFEIVDIFSKHGYIVSVMLTKPNGETEKAVAREADGYDIIVAVGGDGTLNEVVNGILSSDADVPLGYIPLGSTNDFGTSLKLPKKIEEACKKIAESEPKWLDLGRFGDKNFTYIACSGLFSSVSYMTSQQLKNVLGHGAYVLKGLSEIAQTKSTFYSIELDDETIEGDFWFVGISNTLRAGGFSFYKNGEVDFDDGYFELNILKAPKNILNGTLILTDLFTFKSQSENFIKKKVKKAIIRTKTPQKWSLDGENGGEKTEVTVEVRQKTIKFFY